MKQKIPEVNLPEFKVKKTKPKPVVIPDSCDNCKNNCQLKDVNGKCLRYERSQ